MLSGASLVLDSTAATRLAISYAFKVLNLYKLYLLVDVDNAPAIGDGATQLLDGINKLDSQIGQLPGAYRTICGCIGHT